jgi:hypothetical protein
MSGPGRYCCKSLPARFVQISQGCGSAHRKNAWGIHPIYCSLNERPPQPRYDSFEQHFFIPPRFEVIFVTLRFSPFATESAHSPRHGRRPARLLTGVNPPRSANSPPAIGAHEPWRPVLKVVRPRRLPQHVPSSEMPPPGTIM